ncbi:MAG: protealysin propeptide domain-containing protein, partial [Pseudomonas sp.]
MTDSRLLRSFIPPYILNRIIAHGSEPQRTAAMRTLNHVRSLLPNPGPPSRPLAQAILPPSNKPGIAQRSIHDAQNKMLL